MNENLGFARPLLDQRDEENETREDIGLKSSNLFLDKIDEDYDKDPNPNYEGDKGDEVEEEEDELMRKGHDMVDEIHYSHAWGDPFPTCVTR
jgi:hypothetical protein